MSTVTISSKFQMVIPRDVRERLGLTPGQRMHVFEQDGGVLLVPEVPVDELRGSLRGADLTIPTEPDRFS
jgi:AbrB family looped-hinge helix DNA binding protein